MARTSLVRAPEAGPTLDSEELLLCGPAGVELLVHLEEKKRSAVFSNPPQTRGQGSQVKGESEGEGGTSGILYCSTPEVSLSFNVPLACLMVWI